MLMFFFSLSNCFLNYLQKGGDVSKVKCTFVYFFFISINFVACIFQLFCVRAFRIDMFLWIDPFFIIQ